MQIIAVSLGAAQSTMGCTPRATIIDTTEDRHTTVQIEFADLGNVPEGETVAEWLYNMLSRLVENFDDHLVTSISVVGKTEHDAVSDAS